MLIAEELFLLSMDQKKNVPYFRTNSSLAYSLVGSLLAELMLEGDVDEVQDKIIINNRSNDHPLLQETLHMLETKPNQTIEYWVSKLESLHRNIKKKDDRQLQSNRCIRIEKKKVLGLFKTEKYHLKEERAIEDYREQFRQVLEKMDDSDSFTQQEERTLILLSFVHVNELLDIVFDDKREVSSIKKKLKQSKDHLPVSKAVKAIINTITVVI